jgi:dTDP-4-amino-4,6-dideoxygalactose transaminase
MDPALVEPAFTKKTRAILAVHQMGMPCDIFGILEVARRRGLPVIEDAACASGSAYARANGAERVGRPHADIACFSFHPRKVITTGDGGMLTTNDASHDAEFRLLRQHGMSVSDRSRHQAQTVVFEEHGVLGYNYRMTDMQAAVGREQLKRLPEIVATRRRLADRYRELLADVPGLGLPVEPEWARTNWQSFWVELPPEKEQRAVMQALLDRGVQSRRGIMCAHREAPYRAAARFPLPSSEHAQDRRIIVPLFPQMTDDEQVRVADALRAAVRG